MMCVYLCTVCEPVPVRVRLCVPRSVYTSYRRSSGAKPEDLIAIKPRLARAEAPVPLLTAVRATSYVCRERYDAETYANITPCLPQVRSILQPFAILWAPIRSLGMGVGNQASNTLEFFRFLCLPLDGGIREDKTSCHCTVAVC